MAAPRSTVPADPVDRLLGSSPAIAALRTQIRHLATFDVVGSPHVPTVLIAGETGTGKGLVARVLHDSGPRASGPFLEVNCAAIPETMLEAELFGFEAGAFTDAKRAKAGLFEAATQGTLFLDEIDALPLVLQSKLLKAIEEKQIRRLGAVREHPVDVKITAATPVDLHARTADGRFRLDLYHRLAVLLVELPPLRTRRDDIVGLARHFLERYAAGYRLAPKRLSRDGETWLQQYAWPGNVRELGHLMERITLLHPDALVTAEALARMSLPGGPPATAPAEAPHEGRLANDESTLIRQTLAQTQGNVMQAARLLGWTRKALLHRIRRHGITPPGRPRGRPSRTASQNERLAGVAGDTQTAAGGEQKPIAVLAIELTFPEGLGAAPAYEPWTVARSWEHALVEKVQGFGGTLVQRGPSLSLVAFGLPRTLEQLPQRAIQTALALRHLAAEHEPSPVLRQAAHWGPVLIDVAAHESAQRVLSLGDTLALPTRLLGQTGPGEIVLSHALGRLVERWCALERLPSTAAHPSARDSAYRVVGMVPRHVSPSSLEAPALSPFVGRTRELAVLHTLLAAAEGGHGQFGGIVGEPGVGKSRLLVEFRRALAGRRVTYLEARCLSYGTTTPYLSALELLRDTCDLAERAAPDQVADQVRLTLQKVGLNPEEWAPYLLHLLGLPEAMDRLVGISPEALRQRTVEALWQLNLRGSRQQPVVVVIEDLQWVDPSSVAVFAGLVERLAEASILFLATYRPEYRPPWLERSYATQLVLTALLPEDSRHLVQSVWQVRPPAESVMQAILARAEGNPLFLEELTRVVLEQAGTRTAAVPDTLQGVLLARIDRLPGGAKRALQLASVVGRDCPLPVLEGLWDGTAGALPVALTRLVEAELLYLQGVLPEAVYRFKHGLIQEVAYQTLPQGARQQAHERAARVLEARLPESGETSPEPLARHYTAAGLAGPAVRYWQRAGQLAIERSANAEAVQHLGKGLELVATLPQASARAQQELDLLIALGPVLIATKGWAAPEVEETYARARALCARAGDIPQLFPVLRGLWRYYHNRGALSTARQLAEQLDRLAQRTAGPMHLLGAHDALGHTLFFQGDYAAARTHLEQGIGLIDPKSLRALILNHGAASAVQCLAAGVTLWCLGYPTQAVRRSQEALALSQEIAHPYSRATAENWTVYLYHRRRDTAAVQAHTDVVMSLATAHGFPLWAGLGTCWQGWTLAMQGQSRAGMAQIHQGLEAVLATGQMLSQSFCLLLLAEAAGHGGQVVEGQRLLAEALAAFAASERGDGLAEAHRLRGEFLLQQAVPDAAQAEACFQEALAIARRQQAKSWELRAAMSLSQLWQRWGKRVEAQQLLAEIYGWFTEGFDTPDLREAKALLEELS